MRFVSHAGGPLDPSSAAVESTSRRWRTRAALRRLRFACLCYRHRKAAIAIMILYKYVPFAAGAQIIDSNAVLFSQPKTFNDPFDMPTYPDEPAGDPVSAVFAQVRTMGKNYIWAEKTGILSLTRTPANALMWAHYADKHQGMVIGINAETARFTDEQSNFIPAQYGSVIYVSRRVSGPFTTRPATGIAVGETHIFRLITTRSSSAFSCKSR